jgi:hypothetical protein
VTVVVVVVVLAGTAGEEVFSTELHPASTVEDNTTALSFISMDVYLSF